MTTTDQTGPSSALHTVTRRVDAADLDLLGLLPERDGVAWVSGGEGLVGIGTALRLDPGPGADRFGRAERAWTDLLARAVIDDEVGVPGTGPVAIGSFTFRDDAHGSMLVVPSLTIGRRGADAWVTAASTDGTPPLRPALPEVAPVPPPQADRPRYAGSSMPDLHWLEAVAAAVARLADPDDVLRKVVLARDHALWAKAPFSVRGVANRLGSRFPGCFTFVVGNLVGATPELLVRRVGSEVTSVLLAGSTPRGADEREDRALGAALLASQKDALEHRLGVESVREVLTPRCADLDEDGPALLRLDNVQHLATTFRGTLAGTTGLPSALALAAALHPTAAVGGTPRAEAVAAIADLEGMDRGRYAAPVGWLDANGDGEFGIALRCAELSGARARLFAGAGIVADSLPEAELEETRVKLRAMQSVLGDL